MKQTFNTKNYSKGNATFVEKEEYKFEIAFDYEFQVTQYIFIFFSTMDIVSKFGGIGATFQIFLKVGTPFFALKFMTSFAMLIMRKAAQKIRILRLKDIKKYLP